MMSDVRRFKRGSMHVRFNKDDIEKINSGRVSDIEVLGWKLSDADCDFLGDEFCLSNYEMGCLIYSFYFDRVYILAFSNIEDTLMKGKVLKLYPIKPDEQDRETIRQQYGEQE